METILNHVHRSFEHRRNLKTRRESLPVVGCVLGLALAVAAASAIAAPPSKMYKWVDESGVVHYTDKLPPDQIDKGNVELNKEGVTVRKTEPMTTPEQRRAREMEVERQKQQAKEDQETARQDRAILDSYTSEEDIEHTKARALKTVEQSLQSAQSYRDQLIKRKEEAAAKPTPSAKGAPDVSRIDSDIERQNEFIARKKAEMANLIGKYDSDRERFRAAKARQSQRSAQAQNVKPDAKDKK